MNTLETLRAARALISDPKHWTKEWYARDMDGKTCGVFSEAACSFCLVGAITKVQGSDEALRLLGRELDRKSIGLGDFNDTHTHPEVLALFDKAISKLEAMA